MGAAAGSRPQPRDLGKARDKRGVPWPTSLSVTAGTGITGGTGTIYEQYVRRRGNLIFTDIFIDLTGLASSTTDLDIIGVGANPAHIGRITTDVNGIILGGTMTCYEVPAGGADDIDLYAATVGTGVFDGAIGDLVETAVITSGGAWANGTVKPIIADSIAANGYLYLCGGEAGTAATYTAGRLHLQLIGRNTNAA